MSAPIDLSQLPPPQVVEVLDFEQIFSARKQSLLALLPEKDRASVAALLELESEPATKLLQENAYQEIIVRNRINDAAKATMLAFAVGADLDQCGANVDVQRLTIIAADPDAAPPVSAVMEDDDAFRLRIQEAPDGLSVAGPKAAYEYHARSADGRVKDASAISPAPCEVVITVLSSLDDGIAPPDLLNNVASAVNPEHIRPLGDRVKTQSAAVINYEIEGTIYLSAGPESPLAYAAALARTSALSRPRRPLGYSIIPSALSAAMHVEGVRKVVLTSPAADILLDETKAARCTAIRIHVGIFNE